MLCVIDYTVTITELYSQVFFYTKLQNVTLNNPDVYDLILSELSLTDPIS